MKKAVQDFVKKNGGQFRTEYKYSSQGSYKKPDGSINVDYVPPQKDEKKIPDNEGEYIDYVEIK